MRYEGSPAESTTAFKKKDDTAYTYAKFVFLLREGHGNYED